ncbi:hypothetical protein Q6248_28125, partial [Klebsiella pneumoniae]|uniref:hypothetical protein n=1 Tax=Klebsiella pneumoniae TaxID=573 RepID=UPI0027302C99
VILNIVFFLIIDAFFVNILVFHNSIFIYRLFDKEPAKSKIRTLRQKNGEQVSGVMNREYVNWLRL